MCRFRRSNEAILEIVKEEAFNALHGYMSNAGFEDVRQTIAQSIKNGSAPVFSEKNLIMTVGAASGLNVILKSMLKPWRPGDRIRPVLCGVRRLCEEL